MGDARIVSLQCSIIFQAFHGFPLLQTSLVQTSQPWSSQHVATGCCLATWKHQTHATSTFDGTSALHKDDGLAAVFNNNTFWKRTNATGKYPSIQKLTDRIIWLCYRLIWINEPHGFHGQAAAGHTKDPESRQIKHGLFQVVQPCHQSVTSCCARWEQRQHYASNLGRFCQSCERGGGNGCFAFSMADALIWYDLICFSML